MPVGGMALISSLYSRGNLNEKEDPRMWQLGNKLASKFEKITEPFGGINCRDIARMDWTDKEAARDFYRNPENRRKYCIQLVGDTAYALGEILEQQDCR